MTGYCDYLISRLCMVARLCAIGLVVLGWFPDSGWFQLIGSAIFAFFFGLVLVGIFSIYALDFFLALCVIAFRNPVVIFSWRLITWLIRKTRFWARGPGQAVRHRKGA